MCLCVVQRSELLTSSVSVCGSKIGADSLRRKHLDHVGPCVIEFARMSAFESTGSNQSPWKCGCCVGHVCTGCGVVEDHSMCAHNLQTCSHNLQTYVLLTFRHMFS